MLVVEIKVVPASGKHGWVLDKSGLLKCFLKSVPEKGRANKELLKLVAQAVGIPQNQVFLLSGDKNRTKRVKIDHELTYEQFLSLVGIETQKTFV